MVNLISLFMTITLPRESAELGEHWGKLYLVARRLRRNLRSEEPGKQYLKENGIVLC